MISMKISSVYRTLIWHSISRPIRGLDYPIQSSYLRLRFNPPAVNPAFYDMYAVCELGLNVFD